MNQDQGTAKSQAPAILSPGSRDVSTASEDRFGGVVTHQQAELAAIAVAASAKAEVESAYVLAIKNPRNEDESRARILASCRNLKFAECAKYSKPVGGKAITGPSIRFAEEALRLWKNVKTMQTTIYDDPVKRVVKITVIDLESNVSYSKEFVIEKTVERKDTRGRTVLAERTNTYGQKVAIVQATEDEIINKEAALASKTIRNNGLRMIPDFILEEAMEIVDATVKSNTDSDPGAAKRKVMDNFLKLNIFPKQIEEYLGHNVDEISPAEIVDLKMVFTALHEGSTTWAEVLESKKGDKKAPETATMAPGGTNAAQDAQVVQPGVISPETTGIPMLPGEDQWSYEERVAKIQAENKGKTDKGDPRFKPGDASTHQGVSKPVGGAK